MPRASTTRDPFNAVAEHKRRIVLDTLRGGALPVNDIVAALGWPQPMISKHLGVLFKVGLVRVNRVGRQRVYQLDAQQLKTVHDWVGTFERFWINQLDRIKQRAERKTGERSAERN